MKSLETLIRLHRWQLDERRRVLKELEEMQVEMTARLARLEQEMTSEQQTAKADDMRFAYASYAQAAIERRQTIGRSLGELSQRIEAAREAVAEEFRETKKYERLQEERQRRSRAKFDRLRQQELDEVALRGFARQRLS